MAKCKRCGAQITFVYTSKGAKMPCDASLVRYVRDDNARANILTLGGRLVKGRKPMPGEEIWEMGYIPHWSSCQAVVGTKRTGSKKEPGSRPGATLQGKAAQLTIFDELGNERKA